MSENKYKRCGNCLHEGNREAEKCDKDIVRIHMRESGRFCLQHDFRPGWELQGTLFEGIADGTDRR